MLSKNIRNFKLKPNVLANLTTAIPRISLCSNYSTSANITQCTTLKNGIRVATDPLPGHFSAVGIYVEAGSRFEDDYYSGCSHIMDRLAFKSTEFDDGYTIASKLASLGGNYMATSSRESIMYQASVFNEDIEEMFKIISSTVKAPKISNEDVQEQVATADYEIDELSKKPNLILPEMLHIAAYKNNTIGNPLLCPKERLPYINRKLLMSYRDKFYRPERIVTSFIGIDHSKAVELTEKYLGDLEDYLGPSPSPIIKDIPIYTGGELSLPPIPPIGNQPEFSNIYIGFEGLSIDDDDIYALAVLQTLLGGGGSFSAGGPGKGMYSRLYTNVLNQFGYIESAISFNHSYTDGGIFGISASCIPNAAPYLTDIICRQFSLCFLKNSKGSLTNIEVSRAKNQLRSSLLMTLESKLVQVEDLGRQIQVHGKKIPTSEMCEKIDSLTVEDIQRVAERILTGNSNDKSNGIPTVVIQGNRDYFGDVDSVIQKHGLGKPNISNPTKEKTSKRWW